MAAYERPVSRKNGDESVDVWIDGWHINFPAHDERPTMSKGANPGEQGSAMEDLRVSTFGVARAVRRGSWIALVEADGYRIVYAVAKPKVDLPIYRISSPPDAG